MWEFILKAFHRCKRFCEIYLESLPVGGARKWGSSLREPSTGVIDLWEFILRAF
jgi:hypothetical protein